ncbi:MAG: cytochrome c [Arenicellales bacterium]|nr:cytochrome c [Arenicellales bacterium]MDP6551158.1 cytochrome c [Arenicellales bacterium]MDP6918958.1 cytochrome c [Arenicellales bacterium]
MNKTASLHLCCHRGSEKPGIFSRLGTGLMAFVVVSACWALSVQAGDGGISQKDMEALAGARDIYHASCAMCHGYDGVPIVSGVPNFAKGERLDKPDKELLSTIAQGREAMPPWAKVLSQGEQTAVLAYIRVLDGDGLFQEYCESCHDLTMPALDEAIPKSREKLNNYAGPWELCSGSELEQIMQRDDLITLIHFLREIPEPAMKGEAQGIQE